MSSSTSYTWNRYSDQHVMSPGDVPAPKIVVPYSVWQKMQAFALAAEPDEVAGFGIVELEHKDKVPCYVVTDVFILDQEVSGSNTETDAEALHRFMAEHIMSGGEPGQIIFQWHSHVNGSVDFSSTDVSNIGRWTGDLLISCVINLRGEHRCRMDWFLPNGIRLSLYRDLVIGSPAIDEALLQTALAEVEQKVRRKSVAHNRQFPVMSPGFIKAAFERHRKGLPLNDDETENAPLVVVISEPDDDDLGLDEDLFDYYF